MGSFDKLQKNENSNFQYYNILSAYEEKQKFFTNRTYVSLIFYHMVIFRKTLVKKITGLFFRRR